jgi:hypothetical protein
LFNLETLRERAAITVALNSWPLGRLALYIFIEQVSQKAVRYRGGTGDHEK